MPLSLAKCNRVALGTYNLCFLSIGWVVTSLKIWRSFKKKKSFGGFFGLLVEAFPLFLKGHELNWIKLVLFDSNKCILYL